MKSYRMDRTGDEGIVEDHRNSPNLLYITNALER